MRADIQRVRDGLGTAGYVADRPIATTVHLALALEKPVLIEGAAGVGKTEIAKALSRWLDAELVRLQCYEGLDLATAAYEWNYQRQLLHIRARGEGGDRSALEEEIFGEAFLLERPLLRAVRAEERVVLLIDEIDRADEEFEAFLLELLSDFQLSIPELGTIPARQRPIVVLTSNGTRELSDALRRRCLYLWIDYPDLDKEIEILERRASGPGGERAMDTVRLVQRLRNERLSKRPGVAETIDFAAALDALGIEGPLTAEIARDALGALLKDPQDLVTMTTERLHELLASSPDAPTD
ncbi:MAG: MoxR family ATPase [Gemmatimonadetes bacterium]|nr:MoxR family ATPase [Gemmatimonadota bacterium]